MARRTMKVFAFILKWSSWLTLVGRPGRGRRNLRRRNQHGSPAWRHAGNEQGQFGQHNLAARAGFDLGELEIQQRALSVNEVEESDLPGEVTGARDFER